MKNLYVPGSFGSVDYTLAPSVRARGFKVLGLTEKDLLVDLFADAENAQRSLFMEQIQRLERRLALGQPAF